jgi:hypothetical protein
MFRLEALALDASPALFERDIAGSDLILVGGEGCEDFGLLSFRNFDEIKRASEFRSHLIEFKLGRIRRSR